MSQSGIATTFTGYGVLEEAGEAATGTIATGMVSNPAAMEDAGRGITDQFTAYWNGTQAGFATNGSHLTEWLAAGAASNDATHALGDAVDQLKTILDNELSPEAMGTEAMGKEWMKTIARGMQDQNPVNVQTARELAIQSIHAIEDAGLNGAKGQKGLKDIGIYFDQLVASGLTAPQALAMVTAGGKALPPEVIDGIETKYPELVTTGTTMSDKIHQGFNAPNWDGWGSAVAGEWIGGFKDKFEAFNWANLINSTIGPYTHGQSPPPKGPLHDIDKWGENVGAAYINGMASGITGRMGVGRDALGRVIDADAIPPGWHKEGIPTPIAPAGGLLAGGGGPAGLSGSAAGDVHYHVHVEGLVKADTPEDIGRQLRRIGTLGLPGRRTQPVMTR
jgi:hypothetical protein